MPVSWDTRKLVYQSHQYMQQQMTSLEIYSDSSVVHVGFAVKKLALGQIFC